MSEAQSLAGVKTFSDKIIPSGGINETNGNVGIKLWVGTEAEYAAIGTKDSNTLYFAYQVIIWVKYIQEQTK